MKAAIFWVRILLVNSTDRINLNQLSRSVSFIGSSVPHVEKSAWYESNNKQIRILILCCCVVAKVIIMDDLFV